MNYKVKTILSTERFSIKSFYEQKALNRSNNYKKKMIDKNTLFRIFAEKEDKFNLILIKRLCETQAIKYLEFKEILAITGVRRCGKTYLMYYLMQHLVSNNVSKKNILYLNFEDERLAFIEPTDLEKIYEWYLEFSNAKGKLYFFLDEIQNVPLWEKWLARIFEKVKVVISGSNTTLFSSKLATAISGRYVELFLYPFSFEEYILYKDESLVEKKKAHLAESSAKINNYLSEYIEFGGFPEVLLYKKKELLREYYKTILLKDVVSRYNLKYKEYIEKLSLYLLSNFCQPTSLYGLMKENPIGINTIKNYLDFIEKAFLLFFVFKFDYSLRKQHANPKKVYAIDVAMAREISFKFSEDKGRIIENLVFLELKRKGIELYYHKKKQECDFVIKEGIKIKEAIQICYELNEENKKREITGLKEAMDYYKLNEGKIITYSQEEELIIDKKRILVKPLWKWLLGI